MDFPTISRADLLAERLKTLAQWCETRATGEHCVETTLTMLRRKTIEIRNATYGVCEVEAPKPVLRVPHRCVICEGHGNMPGGWHSTLPGVESYGATSITEPCRACNASGILWG